MEKNHERLPFRTQQILWASKDFKEANEQIRHYQKLLEALQDAESPLRGVYTEQVEWWTQEKLRALRTLTDFYNGKN